MAVIRRRIARRAVSSHTQRAGKVPSGESRIQTLGDALAAAQGGDALLAAQARHHDPDLLLSRILLACLAPNIPNRSLRRVVLLIDFCLIFVPFGHYDEPEILRYAITSICPKGADVRHTGEAEVAIDSVDGRCNRACPCDVGDQAVERARRAGDELREGRPSRDRRRGAGRRRHRRLVQAGATAGTARALHLRATVERDRTHRGDRVKDVLFNAESAMGRWRLLFGAQL